MSARLQYLILQNQYSLDEIKDAKKIYKKNKITSEQMDNYLVKNSLAKHQAQGAQWDYMMQHQTLTIDMWISIVKVTKDAKFFVCSGFSNDNAILIRVFNPKTGKQVGSDCIGHTQYIECIDTFQDAQIVSGSHDSTIRIWNISTGLQIGNSCVHGGHLKSVCFSLDGSSIASTCEDGYIRIFNSANQMQLNKCSIGISHHYKCEIDFISNEKIMISSCQHCSLRLWDTQTGRLTKIFKSKASSIKYSPNRKLIASILKRGIQIQEVKKFKLVTKLRGEDCWSGDSFQFSSDSASIILQSAQAEVESEDELIPVHLKLWNIVNRSLQFQAQHQSLVSSLQFAPVQGCYMFGTHKVIRVKLIK